MSIEAERKYREKNRERLRENNRRYIESHREILRKKSRERAREEYQKNPEKMREKARRYRKENKEKVREANRRHREKNLEKMRESVRRYKENNRETLLERRRQKDRVARGIPEDVPVMTTSERSRRRHKIANIKTAVANKRIMSIIEKSPGGRRRAQLMRLSVNEGATPSERWRALEELDRHNKMQMENTNHQNGETWQSTTSTRTQTPRPLPRSTSS